MLLYTANHITKAAEEETLENKHKSKDDNAGPKNFPDTTE
jgi:hypothetical protein